MVAKMRRQRIAVYLTAVDGIIGSMCAWKWLAIALVVLAQAYFVEIFKIYWGGATDLDVRFVVTDAATGLPIPNARIIIEPDCEGMTRRFELTADAEGTACQTWPACSCGGTDSLLGF